MSSEGSKMRDSSNSHRFSSRHSRDIIIGDNMGGIISVEVASIDRITTIINIDVDLK